MAKNPETVITNRIRKEMISRGAHVIKLSDSFTRGVPDAMVVTDRVVMVEFKVDRNKSADPIRTYKSLGLSGAQDHHIRNICRRAPMGVCVILDTVKGGKLSLWLPIAPHSEGDGYDSYMRLAEEERVYNWLNIRQT